MENPMRNNITIKFSALALTLVAAATANAQAVRTEKNMSLELANQNRIGQRCCLCRQRLSRGCNCG